MSVRENENQVRDLSKPDSYSYLQVINKSGINGFMFFLTWVFVKTVFLTKSCLKKWSRRGQH